MPRATKAQAIEVIRGVHDCHDSWSQAVDRQQAEAVAPKQRIADEDELMVRQMFTVFTLSKP